MASKVEPLPCPPAADDDYVFESAGHTAKFGDAFQRFKTLNVLCDTTLISGTTRISVHSTALAAVSTYFYNLLTTATTPTHEIEMNDLDGGCLQSMVDYIYTGNLHITKVTVHNLLSVAERFQLEEVSNVCCAFVSRNITSNNCFGLLKLSQQLEFHGLVTDCHRFVLNHFSDAVNDDKDFLQLPTTNFVDLISCDELCASESTVFTSVRLWVAQQTQITAIEEEEVWRNVRFGLMSQQELSDILGDNDFLLQYPTCQKVILEALNLRFLTLGKAAANESHLLRPRSWSKNKEILMIISSHKNTFFKWVIYYDFKRDICTVAYTEPSTVNVLAASEPSHSNGSSFGNPTMTTTTHKNQWSSSNVTEKPVIMLRMAVTIVNDTMYVLGGFDGTTSLNSVYAYVPATRIWTVVRSMLALRSHFPVAVLDQYIYAIGGFSTENLASVEVYNSMTDNWKGVKPMMSARVKHTAAVLDKYIYVLGGSGTPTSVERYEPQRNVWTPVVDMLTGGHGLAAAALHGYLYVVGGSAISRNAEVFDPQRAIWHKIARTTTCRMYSCLIVHDDKLFAVGGSDLLKSSTSSIEEYDPNRGTWKRLDVKLNTPRHGFGAVLVTGLSTKNLT